MKRGNIFFSLLISQFIWTSACWANNDYKSTAVMNMDTAVERGYSLVNGLNMYYEVYGDGKPLVLIHGGGSTIETTFGRVIPVLSKTHKIIAVELQAHGRTADREQETSFEQDADDVAALLNNLKIPKADIFGFSNGGTTALQVAIRHPALVDKLIVASALYKKSGAPPAFWEFMKKGTFADMPQVYKDAFLAVNKDQDALLRMFKRDHTRMNNFHDIPDELMSSIKAQTLIIMGDKDVASVEHAAEMQRLISASGLMVIPGGHGDYIGEIMRLNGKEVYKEVLMLIEKFL
jgi:pimeloyl-ACP methyl ester carboxylesterase